MKYNVFNLDTNQFVAIGVTKDKIEVPAILHAIRVLENDPAAVSVNTIGNLQVARSLS
jgi:hypothetical protein